MRPSTDFRTSFPKSRLIRSNVLPRKLAIVIFLSIHAVFITGDGYQWPYTEHFMPLKLLNSNDRYESRLFDQEMFNPLMK